jgi:hypothetical protein
MRWVIGVLSLSVIACGPSSGVTETIDSSGGTVEGGGVRVVVPAGALASAREIGVREIAAGDVAALPEESDAVSPLVALTPARHGVRGAGHDHAALHERGDCAGGAAPRR